MLRERRSVLPRRAPSTPSQTQPYLSELLPAAWLLVRLGQHAHMLRGARMLGLCGLQCGLHRHGRAGAEKKSSKVVLDDEARVEDMGAARPPFRPLGSRALRRAVRRRVEPSTSHSKRRSRASEARPSHDMGGRHGARARASSLVCVCVDAEMPELTAHRNGCSVEIEFADGMRRIALGLQVFRRNNGRMERLPAMHLSPRSTTAAH